MLMTKVFSPLTKVIAQLFLTRHPSMVKAVVRLVTAVLSTRMICFLTFTIQKRMTVFISTFAQLLTELYPLETRLLQTFLIHAVML